MMLRKSMLHIKVLQIGCLGRGLSIVSTSQSSESPLVWRMSQWTESPFLRQPVIPQTDAHCSEVSFVWNDTLPVVKQPNCQKKFSLYVYVNHRYLWTTLWILWTSVLVQKPCGYGLERIMFWLNIPTFDGTKVAGKARTDWWSTPWISRSRCWETQRRLGKNMGLVAQTPLGNVAKDW